ncbi:hypothetical protein ACIQVR_39575 [Streptomyces xanthochromogenes]|uniref:hypothetical protein n=1 Tax=Streptomyces xanthochromogenes TaxID=67384 RepID=UPI0038149FAA
MFQPRWSVTWPTRPNGLYTVHVRAADPSDAVRVAAGLDLPLNDGYTLAVDYAPEVWRLRRPYGWRSRWAAGSDFGGTDTDEPFTPLAPDTLPTDVRP